MSRTHEFHVRLYMDRENHKKAWEVLQRMDREEHLSHSDIVAFALLQMDAGGGKKAPSSPSSSDEMNQYVERIVSSVESILKLTIPSFLSGISVPMENTRPDAPSPHHSDKESDMDSQADVIPDEEIDWNFLGEL